MLDWLTKTLGMQRPESMAPIRDLTPEEVSRGLADGTMLLVDVREPREIEAERIAGSVYAPLSGFDPEQIANPEDRAVVFVCAAGVRSVRASEISQAAGLPYAAHLAGGLKAWKAAGLSVEH